MSKVARTHHVQAFHCIRSYPDAWCWKKNQKIKKSTPSLRPHKTRPSTPSVVWFLPRMAELLISMCGISDLEHILATESVRGARSVENISNGQVKPLSEGVIFVIFGNNPKLTLARLASNFEPNMKDGHTVCKK